MKHREKNDRLVSYSQKVTNLKLIKIFLLRVSKMIRSNLVDTAVIILEYY